jgi:hypothetical protein
MFVDLSWLFTNGINRFSALLLLWGLVVLLLLQWRLPLGAERLYPAWLPACCTMLVWFFSSVRFTVRNTGCGSWRCWP